MSHSEDDMIAPVPRVTIQAFCDSPDIATALESAATDRRMQKAHLRVQAGGAAGAVAAFAQAPTPNVIILEVGQNEQAQFLRHLDELSEVCDTGTPGARRRPCQQTSCSIAQNLIPASASAII